MTIEEARIKLSIIKNSYSIRNYFCTDMTHQEKALIDYENLVIGLIKENQQLKEQLERSEKARLKCLNKIKTLGKFDGEILREFLHYGLLILMN